MWIFERDLSKDSWFIYIMETNIYTYNIRIVFILIFLPFVSITVPPASRTITIPAATSQAWRASICKQSAAPRATYAMLNAADPRVLVLNLWYRKIHIFYYKKIIFLNLMSRFMHYAVNNLQTNTIFIYCNVIVFAKHCKLYKCNFDINFNIYERYWENKLICRDLKIIVLMRNIFEMIYFWRKGINLSL